MSEKVSDKSPCVAQTQLDKIESRSFDSASSRLLDETKNTAETPVNRSKVECARLITEGVLPPLHLTQSGDTVRPSADATPGGAEPTEDLSAGMNAARKNTKGWNTETPPPFTSVSEKLGASKTVFWGDDHLDESSPLRFKKALPVLKEAGVDTVGVELLRENQQSMVDGYLSAQKGSPEEASAEQRIRERLEHTVNQDQLLTNKTMEFIKAAKDAGLKVLCMEPNGGNLYYGGDPGEGVAAQRDSNWADVIEGYEKHNPDSKVLVIAGSTHFIKMQNNPTLPEILSRKGVPSVDLTPPSQYFEGEILLPK